MEDSFDSRALTLADIESRTAGMWSDLAFDQATLAGLKRDGLMLDGVRLTGPSPYLFRVTEDSQVIASINAAVSDPAHREMLLDLWRLHFRKGLRSGSLVA